jgi:hypothetical protein
MQHGLALVRRDGLELTIEIHGRLTKGWRGSSNDKHTNH